MLIDLPVKIADTYTIFKEVTAVLSTQNDLGK